MSLSSLLSNGNEGAFDACDRESDPFRHDLGFRESSRRQKLADRRERERESKRDREREKERDGRI